MLKRADSGQGQNSLPIKHTSSNRYIHRDLAVRNVLVSENGLCKVDVPLHAYLELIF